MTQHILYGGQLSYFTGKARAYLNWKGVDYEERLATREIYKKLIVPRIGYPMIPLLITPDDNAIQDTTEIIDYFEALNPAPSVFPEGPRQRFIAHLLELYGDEWLVIPAMHYRWVHNRDFAYSEFGKIAAPGADAETQFKAGRKAAERFQGAVPMLGATPDMAAAIETSYLALLNELDAHFATHEFVFGSRPSIADFGLIGPLYAHLYRDPASGEIMTSRAPHVAKWVERMQSPPYPRSGDFLADDAIPETLLPILNRMAREQAPCLVDLANQLDAWKSDNPDTEIPRAIGMQAFAIEGQQGQRIIMPYTQWMLQRALDWRASLGSEDKASVDILGEQCGLASICALAITSPVKRKDYKLVWA